MADLIQDQGHAQMGGRYDSGSQMVTGRTSTQAQSGRLDLAFLGPGVQQTAPGHARSKPETTDRHGQCGTSVL